MRISLRARRAAGRLRSSFVASIMLAWVALAIVAVPSLANPIGPATIGNLLNVRVLGLRNNQGRVCCTIFPRSKAFPGGHDPGERTVWAPIADRAATCEFHDLAPGEYAAVTFHDENSDGIFNRNWLGMPKEGFGFSDDAPALWRPPNFNEASFPYGGGDVTILIHIRYGLRG